MMKRSLVSMMIAACALSIPGSGHACMHVVELTKDDAVAAVARADRQLAAGDAWRAFLTARRARLRLERELREHGPDRSVTALIDRTRSITAIAAVRLDGHTPISERLARTHVLTGRTQRSLAWATEQLRARLQADPTSSIARMNYAEALAHDGAHREEARQILTGLAERDLMPDAHGYVALMRVVQSGSDRWHQALTRCQQMAGRAARVCPSSTPSS